MPNCFPLRPRPNPEESIHGYTLRLLNRNGSHKLTTLFKVIEHKFSVKCFVVGSKEFISYTSVLAPFIKLSDKQLQASFADTRTIDRDNKRVIQTVVSKLPKVCVSCLQEEDGYHRHHWQLIHNTHCEIHNTPLIHSCPNCQSHLEWDADLVKGCSCCGLRWRDYSTLPINKLPYYQSVANRLKGHELKRFLDALYLGVMCAKAPNSFRVENMNKYPYSLDEAPELLEKGYWLLAHQAEANAYTQKIISAVASQQQFFNKDSINLLVHPITKLPKLPLPFVDIVPDMAIDTNAIETFSDKQASTLLAISSSELNELAKSSGIDSSKAKNISFYQLKYLDDFMMGIKNMSVVLLNGPQSNLMSIADIAKVSYKFLFNFGDAVTLLLNSDVNIFRVPEPKTLNDFFVERKEVMPLLQSNESSQFTRLLSMDELAKYFGVQEAKIRKIAAMFGWVETNIDRTHKKFEPIQIKAFVDEYLLLNKWCEQQVYHKRSLYEYLINHNITPLNDGDFGAIKLHIFKKSEALFNAIEQFERDWFKSKSSYQIRDALNATKPQLLNEASNEIYALTIKAFR